MGAGEGDEGADGGALVVGPEVLIRAGGGGAGGLVEVVEDEAVVKCVGGGGEELGFRDEPSVLVLSVGEIVVEGVV